MIRKFGAALLAVLASCAPSGTREEGPLDRLIAKSNAYTSFHLVAEITDGTTAVPIEMAFRAPDRALLKYGSVATTVLSGGMSYHALRGTFYSFNHAEAIAELGRRYPGLGVGPAPEAVFTLGDGVRAQLTVGRLGARLGWLEELRGYQAGEGNLYRHGQTEIALRGDGFISRTSMGGHRFVLKAVEINTALPDSLFAVPATDGLQDATSRLQKDLVRGLEEVYHRWMLETSAADDTLEAIIRIDLIRTYEPDKMVELRREGLKKSLAAFSTLHPDARPEVLKDKLLIERGRAQGTVDILEDEIQKSYARALEVYLRGMAVPLTQREALDLERRWQAAVKHQVDEQIRRRLDAVFDSLPKE